MSIGGASGGARVQRGREQMREGGREKKGGEGRMGGAS